MTARVTLQEFISRATVIHGSKYDYSRVQFELTKDYVHIVCPIHGEFRQQVGEHLRGRGCLKCAKNAMRKDIDYYIPTFRKLYGHKYDYSDAQYVNSHTKIKIKCNECGSIFYMTIDNHMRGHGCKYCTIGHYRRKQCLDGEIWRDVQGFEGRYMVSNYGRVKSLFAVNTNNSSKIQEFILSPRQCGQKKAKYLAVILHNGDKKRQVRIHRLVAEAFIPNPNNYTEINHKDENKYNNHVENLEWCSRSYNVNYGTRNEKSAQKTRKPIMAIDNNGNEVMRFDSILAAAKHIGRHESTLSHAIADNKTVCGYKWIKI